MKIDAAITYQKGRRENVLSRVEQAKKEIVNKIDELGYYPDNNCILTTVEFCRVAKIGKSTLKNKSHRATREALRTWMKAMRVRIALRAPARVGKVSDDSLRRKLESSLRNLDIFKLLYEDLERRLLIAEEENSALRQENASLRAGQFRVVPIDR